MTTLGSREPGDSSARPTTSIGEAGRARRPPSARSATRSGRATGSRRSRTSSGSGSRWSSAPRRQRTASGPAARSCGTSPGILLPRPTFLGPSRISSRFRVDSDESRDLLARAEQIAASARCVDVARCRPLRLGGPLRQRATTSPSRRCGPTTNGSSGSARRPTSPRSPAASRGCSTRKVATRRLPSSPRRRRVRCGRTMSTPKSSGRARPRRSSLDAGSSRTPSVWRERRLRSPQTSDFLTSHAGALMDLAEVLELGGRRDEAAETLRSAIQLLRAEGARRRGRPGAASSWTTLAV